MLNLEFTDKALQQLVVVGQSILQRLALRILEIDRWSSDFRLEISLVSVIILPSFLPEALYFPHCYLRIYSSLPLVRLRFPDFLL